MRRLLVITVMVLAFAAAPATAAETTVQVGDDFFSPADVTIAAGDAVKWVWQGPDGDHNVATKAGQAEEFDSDPGVAEPLIKHPAGYTFSYTFNKNNVRVEYVCRVHPIEMQGTVTVGSPPADTAAPGITKAKVTLGKRVKVGFKLDEDSKVALKVTRKGRPKRTLVSIRRNLAAGRRSLSFKRKALGPGRYRVSLTATDDAGNKSTAVRKAFRIPQS